MTVDDVTSGFNIGKNISQRPDFNEIVGFTEAEVRRLVEVYPLRLLTPPLRRRLRPDRYRSGTSTRLSDRRRKMPSSIR